MHNGSLSRIFSPHNLYHADKEKYNFSSSDTHIRRYGALMRLHLFFLKEGNKLKGILFDVLYLLVCWIDLAQE